MKLYFRDDVNAHDMYIPTMAFITYILLSGLSLGSQGRFDPEKLGEITSMATGWIVLEVLVTLFALFIIQVRFMVSMLKMLPLNLPGIISQFVIFRQKLI